MKLNFWQILGGLLLIVGVIFYIMDKKEPKVEKTSTTTPSMSAVQP